MLRVPGFHKGELDLRFTEVFSPVFRCATPAGILLKIILSCSMWQCRVKKSVAYISNAAPIFIIRIWKNSRVSSTRDKPAIKPAGAIKTDAFRVKRFSRNELGWSRIIYLALNIELSRMVTIRSKLARYDTFCFIDRDLIVPREEDSI